MVCVDETVDWIASVEFLREIKIIFSKLKKKIQKSVLPMSRVDVNRFSEVVVSSIKYND